MFGKIDGEIEEQTETDDLEEVKRAIENKEHITLRKTRRKLEEHSGKHKKIQPQCHLRKQTQ